jgi:hypothetical protein
MYEATSSTQQSAHGERRASEYRWVQDCANNSHRTAYLVPATTSCSGLVRSVAWIVSGVLFGAWLAGWLV